jgi:soluble lytic murein transglycosylase
LSARVRALVVVLLVTAAAAVASTTPRSTPWMQAFPGDKGEVALRDAVVGSSARPGSEMAAALGEVARAHKGTRAAGLASLAAGLALLDAGRHAEAIGHLSSDDIKRTPLQDHALMARGRAQEVLQQVDQAIASYLAASDAIPRNTLFCSAYFRAAELQKTHGRLDDAIVSIKKGYEQCDTQRARALLLLGLVHEQRQDTTAASEQYRRVEDEHPATLQAVEAVKRLNAIRAKSPAEPPGVRTARELKRAVAVFDAGRHADTVSLFTSLLPRVTGADRDLVTVRLARALTSMDKTREAARHLAAVPAASPHAAEAQFARARLLAAKGSNPVPAYLVVARDFPKSTWAEESLNAVTLYFQKDARHDEALPYYRKLRDAFPSGVYAERAAWYTGWGEYREGRYDEAAEQLELLALRPGSGTYAGAALYWSGQARLRLSQPDAARINFELAVTRYAHAYHGILAARALEKMKAPPPESRPTLPVPASAPEIPEAVQDRLHALLLVERLEEALDELKALPRAPRVSATISWIEWRRHNLRNGITWMKRAYPEHVSAAGAQLPDTVWRILYPLDHADALVRSALAENLDPALVAALVCQESTFQADARSGVGAMGLMQLMAPTARELARGLGLRAPSLTSPGDNLRLGSRYLRQMIQRYDGRVERALAAYNAGPTRVRNWTAGHPGMSSEDFVERIPFQETRHYVMTILTSREQYRRIHGLQAPAGALGR